MDYGKALKTIMDISMGVPIPKEVKTAFICLGCEAEYPIDGDYAKCPKCGDDFDEVEIEEE